VSTAVKWISDNKDFLALVVSVFALGLSVWSTRKTVHQASNAVSAANAAQRDLVRMATYQRIHELLVDPKAAAGRRRLFQAHQADNFPALGADGWDDINYSLALYDTLGGYMSRDEVDAQTVLAAWHHPLQNIAEPVARFMEFRRRNGVSQRWAYLHYLLEKSRAYKCTCPTSGQP
jgi:hypothetical protein